MNGSAESNTTFEFWASFFSALFSHFPHPLNLRTCPSQGREVEKEFAKA